MIASHDLPRAAEDGTSPGSDDSANELPPDGLLIVPVRNTVLFPGTVFPIALGRERSIAAAQQDETGACPDATRAWAARCTSGGGARVEVAHCMAGRVIFRFGGSLR